MPSFDPAAQIANTEQNFLNAMADGVHQLLAALWDNLFGPGVKNKVFGPLTWEDIASGCCILVVALLADAFVAWFFRHKRGQIPLEGETKSWRHHFLGAIAKPLHLLIWILGLYLAVVPLILEFPGHDRLAEVRQGTNRILDLALFTVLFWLFYELTRVIDALLEVWARSSQSKLDLLLAPLVGRSLRVIVPVVGIVFALPLLELPSEFAGVLAKGSSILIIGTVAWIITEGVRLGEKAVLTRFDITATNNLQARKVYTQVHVISKMVYVLIAVFTMASVLMLFEEARRFGTSILASAGVVGVIIGFAAQHTIANLFAGFQIALTQPIRLDDVVIVESEWGRVEEITLTYVVVHIWDDRRMILPLSYFIEKPFQNWTRDKATMMGSIFLWVDYTLPLEETRAAAQQIVEASPLWDRRFWNLQVSDATEQTMQLRILATAADSSKLWDLRCEVREKLIAWVQRHHPECLPRKRMEIQRGRAVNQPNPA